jgi:hypothetical protein
VTRLTKQEREERELEQAIDRLVDVRQMQPPGSAAHAFATRALAGLWHGREEAGGIIMELDPEWWEVLTYSSSGSPPDSPAKPAAPIAP